jgi:hypothetical protein
MNKNEYVHQLPRRVVEACRCQAMDADGNRCESEAGYETYAFVERSTDLRSLQDWFTLNVCHVHARPEDIEVAETGER